MVRLWLSIGVLSPLFAVLLAQGTPLAENHPSHPDSPQASGQNPGDVSYGQDLDTQNDQRPLQVPTPPIISDRTLDVQGPISDRAVVRRIVAVGDLHGDYGNARKVLEMSGVIDKKGDWSGKVDFFVQIGDIIDL